jgi:hypothetical protein
LKHLKLWGHLKSRSSNDDKNHDEEETMKPSNGVNGPSVTMLDDTAAVPPETTAPSEVAAPLFKLFEIKARITRALAKLQDDDLETQDDTSSETRVWAAFKRLEDQNQLKPFTPAYDA